MELDKKQNDQITFDGINYRVVRNNIVTGKQRKKLVVWMNIFCFGLMLGFMALYSIITGQYSGDFSWWQILGALVSFLVYIVVHEWIHAVTYRAFGKMGKEAIRFGFDPKTMVAYCISLVPTTVKTSRWSLMMPLYVCALPIFILSLLVQNFPLAVAASLFISGSAGDLWYMWTLRKDAGDLYMIEAMPGDAGYALGYYLLDQVEDAVQ